MQLILILIELAIIVFLIWGARLIIIDNEILSNEIKELEKSNKELLNANYKLTQNGSK
jgi:cell division protein FtsB